MFRLAHMRFPVDYSFVDAAAVPEPQRKRRLVARADLFDLRQMSPPTTLVEASQRLQRDIVSGSRGGKVVRFISPDSDAYVVEYRFARGKSCWQLVQVSDSSL
jgi:hypothetical protein